MSKNKREARNTTVRIRRSKRRAGNDPELLFYWLEQFVNLGDDRDAFQAFDEECPSFLPVTFYDATAEEARDHPVAWQPEFHQLFRVFREMLREVWERGGKQELATLLGVDTRSIEIINRQTEPGPLHQILGGFQSSLHLAAASIPKHFFAVPTKVSPDWRTGTFRYEPDTDFRRAVYDLFRQSWRAKVCPQCNKYFIADKPPQRYCSPKCYGAAKRGRDLEFWRNIGSDLRKKRKKKEEKQ
jgi:hypothetical protein